MIRKFNLPTELEIIDIDSLDFHSQKDSIEFQTLADFLYVRRSNRLFRYGNILYDLDEESSTILCVKDVIINEKGELVQENANTKN